MSKTTNQDYNAEIQSTLDFAYAMMNRLHDLRAAMLRDRKANPTGPLAAKVLKDVGTALDCSIILRQELSLLLQAHGVSDDGATPRT